MDKRYGCWLYFRKRVPLEDAEKKVSIELALRAEL